MLLLTIEIMMSIFLIPAVMLGLVLLIIICHPITVLIHELGHAIPGLMLTRDKITVYIGSYGDPKRSFMIKVGRLDMWFRYSLFWRKGMCSFSETSVSITKAMLIILCGPIASLLVALIGGYLIFAFDLHGALKLLIVCFSGSAIFDLFVNLIPDRYPDQLYNGSVIHNDGYKLKRLWSLRKFWKEYDKAAELFNAKEYISASRMCECLIARNCKDEDVYRLAISSMIYSKQYEKALSIHEDFKNKYYLLAEDYANSGLLKSLLGMESDSLLDYDKALELAPSHLAALNNKGYLFIIQGRYTEAIHFFDKAIEYSPEFTYSYSNRGLAKIKLGQIDDGLKDIHYGMQLDARNPYAYRNLGIYHLDRNEVSQALELFRKAKDLDADTHLIDTLIFEAINKSTKQVNQ